MSNTTQSQTTFTERGILERQIFSTVTTVPCFVFLFLNGTLLYTLRRTAVFYETPRYILLFNLLFADTAQLVQSQLLYLIAACRIRLAYPVCGVLSMLANLTHDISPLTLVVMSVERYVAVCHPLRHAAIITVRNTGVAIGGVWLFSSLNVFTRVCLLLAFPFEDHQSLQMKEYCDKSNMLLSSSARHYDRVYTYFLFISAGVTVTCSYIGVMVAARSASTDRASAQKARNTLLLHLLQLGLSLVSTVQTLFIFAISKALNRLFLVHVHIVVYVCIVIFPRCLSALIYGIRDQTLRPVLLYHLCCHLKLKTFPGQV
ncbi:odorant receptor 131-2-like [Echeneis naucrates]|uniref:odorant receptor 131-2-like n=1 Tax=Echeneis naucrates TaxID=173247 RepID=UPI001113C27D|nr:odorant receptor 131-2-like [Echeneis naucrates]